MAQCFDPKNFKSTHNGRCGITASMLQLHEHILQHYVHISASDLQENHTNMKVPVMVKIDEPIKYFYKKIDAGQVVSVSRWST